MIPVIAGGQEPAYFHNESNRDGNIITVSASGAYSGFVNYFESPIFASDSNTIQSKDETIISTKLIYQFLKYIQPEIYKLQRGQAQPHVYGDDLGKIKIPLPPQSIQEKIISQLNKIEEESKELSRRIQTIYNNIFDYIESCLNQSKDIAKLGEIADFKRGPFGGSLKKEIFVDKGYKVYEQQHAINNDFNLGRYYITEEKFNEMKSFQLFSGDLIMSCSGTIGKIAMFPENAQAGIINQALLRFRAKPNIALPEYLKICLSHITSKFEANSHGTGLKNVASVEILKSIDIYCPQIQEQQKIVSEIKKTEAKIKELKKELAAIPEQKEAILKKYL